MRFHSISRAIGSAICAISMLVFSETAFAGFAGTWAFSLSDGNPVWLRIDIDSSGALSGKMLWSVGSARRVKNLSIDGETLTLKRRVSWKPGGESVTKRVTSPFTATLVGDDKIRLKFQQITVGEAAAEQENILLAGKRIPPPPARPDLSRVEFSESEPLFNGRDLTGWKLSNSRKTNGWSVVDGVLTNTTPKKDFGAYGSFGNLVTERVFEDFELTVDYNVEKGGNSGIYLRGMYEAQVVDRDSKMQGIQGPGAIFGRIEPNRNAARESGEWNQYVLTLVDRHITVVLNGETVIDNQLLEGCTGGGIQADDSLPGPIFLQGDHTSIRYRNISIRTVVKGE